MTVRTSRPRRTRERGEHGAAMVLGAIFFAFLALPLCALGVDTARWWVEAQRLQAAADAASTAGVTYMPQDFAKAKDRAVEVAKLNGYETKTGTTVTVVPGPRPTQLKVTISQAVDNFFAKSFGVGTSTLTRGSVADYNGPAPLGSPCPTFGNEPAGTALRGPEGTVLTGMIPAPAVCSSNPQFWALIGGPEWPKGSGDQFMTRGNCSGIDGCNAAGKNTEYDPNGYFYVVKVATGAVGKPVTVQLFDPAFVAQGDFCEAGPTGSAVNNDNWNNWTTTDAKTRYKVQSSSSMNSFCTGDVGAAGKPAVTTSFGLRGPTDTNSPLNGAPITSCARQYKGYQVADWNRDRLRKGAGAGTYNDELAKVFHHWVPMCTFTPATAGDHYLQVRTNITLNSTLPDPNGGFMNNQQVFKAGEDASEKGDGANRFAIRVSAPGVTAGDLSVSASERMPVYANLTGASSEFNMVRVIPAAATKTLVLGFFDVGDATAAGTLTILPPTDSNITGDIANCQATGYKTMALPGCKISGLRSGDGWNGKSQYINIPIPSTYNCNATTQGGCWFRVRIAYPAGTAVQDSTTWTAKIEGEPIRLVE